MNTAGAAEMERTIDRVRLAGLLAQLLRPAGFDAEIVYLVSALQNLGRLLVQYHFAEEAEQVRQLMRPVPADGELGTTDLTGMSEVMACMAVLGVGMESLGTAVAKHWGLGEEVQHMMRRLDPDRPVRSPDNDGDILRATASAANEAVDVLTYLPHSKMSQALAQVTQRYTRLLKLEPTTLTQALQRARGLLRDGHVSVGAATVAPPSEPNANVGSPSAGTGVSNDSADASTHTAATQAQVPDRNT